MLRIVLFVATNFAIVLVLSIVASLFGFDRLLAESGTGYNLTGMLAFAAIIGFGGSFVSLFLSKWMAKMSTRTQIISTPSAPYEQWLVNTVQELAQKANIGMPEVGIFPSQQANAFATGWNKNNALVAVSDGLMNRFSEDEIRAVLAHEIGHVANGDMVTLSLIQGVMNTFVIFLSRLIGTIVDKVVFKNDRGHGLGFYAVYFIAQIVLGFLAQIVVMWFSRWREYRADAAGAHLASRASMIAALERLQNEYERPNEMPDTLTAFGINGGGLKQMFASHPPLSERIEALKQGTGLR